MDPFSPYGEVTDLLLGIVATILSSYMILDGVLGPKHFVRAVIAQGTGSHCMRGFSFSFPVIWLQSLIIGQMILPFFIGNKFRSFITIIAIPVGCLIWWHLGRRAWIGEGEMIGIRFKKGKLKEWRISQPAMGTRYFMLFLTALVQCAILACSYGSVCGIPYLLIICGCHRTENINLLLGIMGVISMDLTFVIIAFCEKNLLEHRSWQHLSI